MGLSWVHLMNCHFPFIIPFMTKEKAGSLIRCTIIDLSWPKIASVNDGVEKLLSRY